MGIPLIAGRDFSDKDRNRGQDMDHMPTVCIVNRNFAEHFFGKESPWATIAHFLFRDKPKFEIIGVVENSTYRSPREAADQREIYFSEYEAPVVLQASFYVRASSDSRALIRTLHSIVANLDPSLPIMNMKTLDTQLDEILNTERLIASLSVVFGLSRRHSPRSASTASYPSRSQAAQKKSASAWRSAHRKPPCSGSSCAKR